MKKLLLPLIGSMLFAGNLDNVMLEMEKGNYNNVINLLKQQKETKEVKLLLGTAYFKRHLIYTDYEKALKYFKDIKNPKSYYFMGKMYQNGLGVKQDVNEAVRYYQLSNTKEAKYELAKLYLKGEYVLKNPKLAFKLLKESAKEGYSQAQLELGKLYLNDNELVDKNLIEASKWIYLSSKNSNEEAKKLWTKYKLYKYQ